MRLAVDQSFYNALGAQALLKVAADTVAARQSVADRVGALAQSKLRSELDASFAEVDLAQARLLRLDAENSQKASLAVLSAVLGYDDEREFVLVDDTRPLEAPSSDVGALIARGPRAHGPRSRRSTSTPDPPRDSTSRKRTSLLPNVRALGAAGGAPLRNDAISPWYGAIGVNVEIPVFNGYLFQARAAEAGSRRKRRASGSPKPAMPWRATCARAGSMRPPPTSASTCARRLLEQTNRALELARSRYDLGLSSIVELSQAQLQRTRAELAETDARYRYRLRLSQAVLRFEIGGP